MRRLKLAELPVVDMSREQLDALLVAGGVLLADVDSGEIRRIRVDREADKISINRSYNTIEEAFDAAMARPAEEIYKDNRLAYDTKETAEARRVWYESNNLAAADNDLSKRKGIFLVARSMVKRYPTALLPVFAKMVIVRCELMFSRDAFEYHALSPLFEIVDHGDIAPFYDIIANSDGTIAVEQVSVLRKAFDLEFRR